MYLLETFMNLEHQQEECVSATKRQNEAAVNSWMMTEWGRADLSLEPGSDIKASAITVSRKGHSAFWLL